LSSHSDDRQELASSLRALRLDAGLSTTGLARQLDWSQSKVSRVERGVTLAKPAEVDEWARVLHAPAEDRRRLIELAEEQGVELLEWKRAMAPGRRRLQEEIHELEVACSTMWVFSMNIVPGLAQTRSYAETVFRIDQDPIPSESEIAEATEARLARQAVLEDPAKRFKLLCTEAALRRSLLPDDAMRSQIQRLIEVAALPTVELGVIPFSARERVHTVHAFAVLGDPNVYENALVLAELVTRGLTIRTLEEIRGYIKHYQALAEGAVFGDELVALLRGISAQAPWS